MKVHLYSQTGITTVYEVQKSFIWCRENFGDPNAGRWTYGKYGPEDSPLSYVSSPMEIEWLGFTNKEDAAFFLLRWK